MSPNVGNFVHDLVEMAKAMETLPQVQAELERAYADNSSLIAQTNSLKADLEQSRNYAASLEQKVRSLEVERDDASFRVLEAEDLTHNTLSRLRAIQTALGGTVDALDPPKPEPELQPQAVLTPSEPDASGWNHNVEPLPQGSSEPPFEPNQNAAGTDTTRIVQTWVGSEEAPKSDANPTTTNHDVGGQVSEGSQNATIAQDGSIATVEGIKGPYFGKHYGDFYFYVPLNDWLAGGGAEADYYWSTDRSNSGPSF